jgi:parallel beta helix pectate lyase-like protein
MVSLLMSRGRSLFGRVPGVVLLPCILLLQSCSQGTEPSTPKPVHEVPAGVDPTGATDVTAEFQAFLDTVPDNSTIVLPAGATYRVEGVLTLIDRNGLTFEGNGATVLATTDGSCCVPGSEVRERSQWRLVGGSGYVFRHLTVKGANPNAGVGDSAYVQELEAQQGFQLSGVNGIELDNVTVTDVYGDFVFLGGKPVTLEPTRNVLIHDSHFERNGRQGIAFVRATDVLVERNYLGQTRRSTMDFEPNSVTGEARRITVRNNTFGPGRLRFVAGKGKGGNFEDILIEDNQLVGRSLDIQIEAATGERRRRIIIRNNVSDDTFGSPLGLMRFARIDTLVVTGNVNRLQASREMTAVVADSSCAVTVNSNVFEDALQEYSVTPVGYICP